MLGLSFIFFSLSCFYTAYFDTDVDFWHIGLSRFMLGCGLVVFITPLFTLSARDVPQDKLASSTGFSTSYAPWQANRNFDLYDDVDPP